MSEPETLPPKSSRIADLQFERAELPATESSLACAFCKSSISESYYHIAGAVACPTCASLRQHFQQRPKGLAPLLRASLYGLGAAIAGSIIFALVSLTGFQFGIVAILVGIMVGKAMRYATRGRTSRIYQVMAVVLTYGAITTSYIPGMISEAIKHPPSAQTAPAQPQVVQPPKSPLLALTAAAAVLVGISLVLPFLFLADSLFSGAINLLIIFIGLAQAWRLTVPDRTLIMGPYLVSDAKPADLG
jgi:hypothetical protein